MAHQGSRGTLPIYWAIKEFRSEMPKLRFLILPGVLFLPLVVVTVLIVFIGFLSLIVLICWCLLWLLSWLLSIAFGYVLTARTILYVATTVAAILIILLVRRSYSGNSLKDQTGAESEAQVVERRTRLQKTKSRVLKNLKWWFIGLPVYFVGLMYAVKALVYIWDPATASFLKHQYILFVGILSGLIYSISIAFILSEWLKAEDRRVRLKGLIVTICVMFIVYIASVGYYSYSLYPQLPNGLGGGQPTPIILWIDKEDFPVDLQKRFPNATFSSDDKITKCEKLYLLYSNSDTLILTDGSNQAPGVLLKRDDIKAIAW